MAFFIYYLFSEWLIIKIEKFESFSNKIQMESKLNKRRLENIRVIPINFSIQ